MTAEAIINEVVRERLSRTRILDVKVDEDVDGEGEPVFRVVVVYDEAGGALDAHETVSLARHARLRLSEADESRFPIFRFMSQGDARKLRAAAA